MKTYIDYGSTIVYEGMIIPKNIANIDYQQFLDEEANGKAKLEPPTPTWNEIKHERNQLLIQSDWTTIPDANPKPNKQAWLDYRQALRDIPQNFTNPQDVVWPTKP